MPSNSFSTTVPLQHWPDERTSISAVPNVDLFGKHQWKDVSATAQIKELFSHKIHVPAFSPFIVGYSERGHVVVVVLVYVRAWILDNCRHDVDEDR